MAVDGGIELRLRTLLAGLQHNDRRYWQAYRYGDDRLRHRLATESLCLVSSRMSAGGVTADSWNGRIVHSTLMMPLPGRSSRHDELVHNHSCEDCVRTQLTPPAG